MPGALWTIVTSFNVLFLVNLWWLDRTDNAPFGVFTPDDRWESVPIFGLSLGSLFTLISLLLLASYARRKRSENRLWYDRIPWIWLGANDLGKDEKRVFKPWWQRFVILVCVIFPITAHVHFWNRFDDWQAWRNREPGLGQEVSLFESVSPLMFLDWDAYRYGNHSKRSDRQGVSYVPLYQPILMAAMSAAVLVSCLFAIQAIFVGGHKEKIRNKRQII